MDINYAKYLLERTRQDYNLIAEDFSRTRSYLPQDFKLLAEYIKDGDKVLDLGCGNGRLIELFQNKNVDYSGTDNSEKLIEIAKKKYPHGNFIVSSALSLPFPDNFFDKIYTLATFHHIPSRELRLQFLKEAKRVLRPGGLLILTVWNLWQRKTAWELLSKYTFQKLIGKSKLDFKDIFYPWKGSSGKRLIQRYFHLFTQNELKEITREAGFNVKKNGILRTSGRKESNICLIAEKLDKSEILR